MACLAADRDWFRDRLADYLERHEIPDLRGGFGPADSSAMADCRRVCFGLALGSKWNALYTLAAFALLSLAWDIGARRLAGARSSTGRALLRDGIPAFVSLVGISAVVYLSSWASWLATRGGYGRDWGELHPDATSTRLLGKIARFVAALPPDIWNFHTGDFINNAEHAYRANPSGWLIVAGRSASMR